MSKVKHIFEHTDCVSEEKLTHYLSGQLSPAEKHAVERHLADCEMCSDAVEGLNMIPDKKKLKAITSELNQKIQNRVEKKEVKIVFLRQYRTQLAVAASIVLILGLVWFFRSNMSMKELDPASAEKIFADKFEAPPAEKEEMAPMVDPNASVAVTLESAPPAEVSEEAGEAAAADVPSSPEASGVKEADDQPDADVKSLKWADNASKTMEDNLAQKTERISPSVTVVKKEEKEKESFWRNKNMETEKGNVVSDSKVTTRDERPAQAQGGALAGKEASKNQNSKDLLKEKDTDDESKKSEPVLVMSPSSTVVTGSGAASSTYELSVQDKSAALEKQDVKKPSEDWYRADEEIKADREQSGKGEVMAYETAPKAKADKSGGKKRAKSASPSKGYADLQTTSAAPAPETKTIVTQTESNENRLDSVRAGLSFHSAIATGEMAPANNAMNKYDQHDYAGAVIDFEEMLKKNPNDEKALFYSAVSYLSLGQTEKALNGFNKILQNKNSKYFEDAQWYASLAYIKNNDLKNARSNLIQLQNNENSRYKKQADETLKEMKK